MSRKLSPDKNATAIATLIAIPILIILIVLLARATDFCCCCGLLSPPSPETKAPVDGKIPTRTSAPPRPPARDEGAKHEAPLRDRLSYLADIPEVAWVEFEDNNVYIGFRWREADWKDIVRAAAANGSIALDGRGCHVWAVKAADRGWRPGDGPYYGEATVRNGRLESAP